MADKLSERLDRIVRAPGIANNPAYTDAIREAAELARRAEGAEVGRLYAMAAGDWIVTPDEDGDVFQLYVRVRLVPEPPEVG